MFDNKEVDKSYFTTPESRNFCLGMPGWCPCIDCTGRSAEDTAVATISDEPEKSHEVTWHKDTESIYSKPSTTETAVHRPMSLNRHRKRASPECSENQPPTAKNDKKPHPKKPQNSAPEERFSFNIEEDDLEAFKKGECPANTIKIMEWAMKNFESWRIARNSKFKDQCPERWFEDTENLCGWLCRFVAKTRKADGGEYTPRSIYLLLAGLQRKVRQANPKESFNVFTDARFKELRNVCDSVFKRLHQKGVGSETKSTPVLTQLEEDKLWESGVLNLNAPVGVLRAVFSLMEKAFAFEEVRSNVD